jgi:hypothetical protein
VLLYLFVRLRPSMRAVNSSLWGGWALMEYYTQRQAFDIYGGSAVSEQASGSFLDFIAAAGGGGTSQTVAAWFAEATTVGRSSFFGGNGQPTPGTWTQWFVVVPCCVPRYVFVSCLGPCGPRSLPVVLRESDPSL